MIRPNFPALPIGEALPALKEALAARRKVLLQAPPGAGKSTIVPLALLGSDWLAGRTLLMLEPRRIAARAVAQRMAHLIGETVVQTVGIRTRLETRVSRTTRIEVVTEGILTRMLQSDPALEHLGCVIFDEFHERSLNADLGLALCLESQETLREDLRVLVMSATLETRPLARLLDDAPIIEAHARTYEVTTHYVPRRAQLSLELQTAQVLRRALAGEEGDILCFLPGAAEIGRVQRALEESSPDSSVSVQPLYGERDAAAQDAALRASPAGRRKIVLATSIAETSLTIEGVRVVIDSGLMRVPVYEPDVGLTRLETVRVSRANADQRLGRAGRTEPGICYRLWEEAANGGVQPFAAPEILSADLSGLALDCALWGVSDPSRLAFLDPPPRAALKEAHALLTEIGAIDGDGRITEEGRAIASLALPPRLARMVVDAARAGEGGIASEIAVVLTERGLGGDTVDLAI